MSPGPDTGLILRNALTSGRLAGLVTVFGVQIGLLGHTALAVFGISVIIARTLLFKMVALAGAVLAWLGFESFRGRGSDERIPRRVVAASARSATVFYAIRLS